jgi:hypothetical protein
LQELSEALDSSCYLELKTIRSFWKEKAGSRVISALLGVLKDADFFG